jgi:hypothetical protein
MRTKLWCAVASALLAVIALCTLTPAASAATQSPYPNATAEYGASARTQPYLNNTYWGYVLHDPGTTGNQTVAVKCWYDGDTATGNYTSNRWFRVLVWESYDGYPTPRFLFVHSSYVFNQPRVPECQVTGVGIQ